MTTDADVIVIDGETFVLADVAANPRQFLELYADRCADLAHEYAGRVAAEGLNDALVRYAAHLEECDALRGRACDCGLETVRAGAYRMLPASVYARLVALGRAALAYERHRGTPAGRELRQAYLDALRAAQEAER